MFIPPLPGIRKEEIAPGKPGCLLQEGGMRFIHQSACRYFSLSYKSLIKAEQFGSARLEGSGSSMYPGSQCFIRVWVGSQLFIHGDYIGMNIIGREVVGNIQPTLNGRAATGRPVVIDQQYFYRHSLRFTLPLP